MLEKLKALLEKMENEQRALADYLAKQTQVTEQVMLTCADYLKYDTLIACLQDDVETVQNGYSVTGGCLTCGFTEGDFDTLLNTDHLLNKAVEVFTNKWECEQLMDAFRSLTGKIE